MISCIIAEACYQKGIEKYSMTAVATLTRLSMVSVND